MNVNRKIITSVNFGYVPLLRNFRHFLTHLGLLGQLHVFSVGEKCANALDALEIAHTPLESDDVEEHAISFGTQHWKRLTYSKVQAVSHALAGGGDLLYSDPDVIFQRDPFEFLERLPDLFDIYAQSDYPGQTICSGFMYLRNNPQTRDVFSIPWEQYRERTTAGDQVYINSCRGRLRLYTLPQDLFLNGVWFDPSRPRYALNEQLVDNAYIFHYNYTGDLQTKYERMRKLQHLSAELCRAGAFDLG